MNQYEEMSLPEQSVINSVTVYFIAFDERILAEYKRMYEAEIKYMNEHPLRPEKELANAIISTNDIEQLLQITVANATIGGMVELVRMHSETYMEYLKNKIQEQFL